MEYASRFEELTDLINSLDGFDIPAIYAALAELCKLLRVSKVVTTFYASTADEGREQGDSFVCYDSGETHVPVSSMRFETPLHSVIVCNVFQAKGAVPLTDQELKRVQSIQRMMISFTDRTNQDKIIQKLTYCDAEGYHNLRYFYEQIMKLVAAGQIVGRTAVRLNLRRFSMVNDQVGRLAGDRLLRKYCDALESAFNGSGVLCRLGGDNFVLLFETAYLPRVVQCLEGLPVIYDPEGMQRVEISADAGIYSITDPDEVHEPGDIMERIIPAYLIARKDNTSGIIYYSEDLQQQKNRAVEIQRIFQSALDTNEFLVYYQPKVDVETRELVGAEALCRWMHDGRLIPPLEFIPSLERGTDICRLDFYMLDHVCKDIRRWADTGMPLVKISVNLSRRHMMDPDLFEHIVEIIDRNGVPHEYIEIELTETTTDVEFRDLKRIVNNLQEAGISTSVDDFGVGYSSLNLIKEIPWNVLKLDKSILPSADENQERGNRMFAHVVAMAHEIGLRCVAEGVETQKQLDIMRHYGCRIAQGFLFDRPLPVKAFEERLNKHDYL